ncbi:hypothetical protein U472_03790 [Orenia metallireducens]|jgi:hypothetical protein|uniref:Terminase small subunit n=1 Tax=Orenia metallireducens TaxID=1413210 RepID=A0A1C0ABH1_9FIRM|nr:terminase small subunit [Orenia metallireducens]OCL27684.1 hypothetical protein U472_03790 [Orenia metallireducens]
MLKKILYYLSKLLQRKITLDKNFSESKIEKEEFPEDTIVREKWGKLKGKESNPLNKRQKRFVIEYLKDYNIEKSAIRAGYSKRTAMANGTTLLSLAKINKAIKEERSKRTNK